VLSTVARLIEALQVIRMHKKVTSMIQRLAARLGIQVPGIGTLKVESTKIFVTVRSSSLTTIEVMPLQITGGLAYDPNLMIRAASFCVLM
jgi:hypothetical protein